MRIMSLCLVLLSVIPAVAKDKYRGPVLLWNASTESYRELTAEEARFFRMMKDTFLKNKAASTKEGKLHKTKKRDFAGTDEELQSKLGITPDTTDAGEQRPPEEAGEVHNASATDYKFEIDSWAGVGFARHNHDATVRETPLRAGPSLRLYRFNENWKLNGDLADSFAGLSINRDFTALLRPSLGLGVGTPFDGSWEAYFKGSFRVW